MRTFLVLALMASAAHGQGITGVTRRTPMLERQLAARRFFDAAGINVTAAGGSPPIVQPLAVQAPPRQLQAPSLATQRARPLLRTNLTVVQRPIAGRTNIATAATSTPLAHVAR